MKFSIRDLFWLTVVVALALGWWLDIRERDRRVREEVDRIYSLLENRAAALSPLKK